MSTEAVATTAFGRAENTPGKKSDSSSLEME